MSISGSSLNWLARVAATASRHSCGGRVKTWETGWVCRAKRQNRHDAHLRRGEKSRCAIFGQEQSATSVPHTKRLRFAAVFRPSQKGGGQMRPRKAADSSTASLQCKPTPAFIGS